MQNHVIRLLNGSGDTAVEFAPPDVITEEAQKSRASAEAIFNRVMATGGTVVSVDEGREGTLRSFDPSIKESIAFGQVVGG